MELDGCFSAYRKPLPVIFLLDVSGSMSVRIDSNDPSHTKRIENLNQAVADCLQSLREQVVEVDYLISIITFGEDSKAKIHTPPTAIQSLQWLPLGTYGTTPMGAAFSLAKSMIEDRSQIPSNAYKPTVILVSDGGPTDNWQGPLNDFVSTGRSSKCDRVAIAIGKEATTGKEAQLVLNSFVKDGGFNDVFQVEDAAHLHLFFRQITMSISQKATRLSQTTNNNYRRKTTATAQPTQRRPISRQFSNRQESSSFSRNIVFEDDSSSED